MTNLPSAKIEDLLNTFEKRFNTNKKLSLEFSWQDVGKKLLQNPSKLSILNRMEETGGEPNLLKYDKESNQYIFFDCSKESPAGRRNLCYDNKVLEARKKFKPISSVLDEAKRIGIELLNEGEYRFLQEFGQFDTKTSSWIETPRGIRDLGGALFGDYRYGQVFIYHNGADSYYSSRGFRGLLKV
ncbi:MAG: DUF4256 domain-containing protein [Patescibacteria group bacterium]